MTAAERVAAPGPRWRARRSRLSLGAAVLFPMLLLGLRPVGAHDPIDHQGAEEYAARIAVLTASIAGRHDAVARGEALFALGETIRRVIDALNRERAAHARLGLVATALLREVEGRGIALSLWPEANRYRSYLAPFEEYVAVLPDGPRRADVLFRLVEGRFYDSFLYDPRDPVGLDWAGLLTQIRDAEALTTRYPGHADREEALFILAVHYLRASRLAPDPDLRQAYENRAGSALEAYRATYPGTLRAAAARTFLAELRSGATPRR